MQLLVGFDAQAQKFELFNPHGLNGSLPSTLKLTFAQLVKNCSYWTSASL